MCSQFRVITSEWECTYVARMRSKRISSVSVVLCWLWPLRKSCSRHIASMLWTSFSMIAD
uniref:Uncharacterized protein n=1 Tax=Aegilops tauschii subsp. strangulata TaxID=200361 RepID=A0A453DMF6_AEGTS